MRSDFKSVVQEEETGCGIAAVANLVGKSYSETKDLANQLGIYAEDQSLWSDTEYVRRLLKAHGVNAEDNETPFESWSALPDTALLAIKYHLEAGLPFLALGGFQAYGGHRNRTRLC